MDLRNKSCSDQSRGFGKAAIDPIKKWFNANLENPYPSQAEKESLAEKSGLSVEQVSNRLGRERHNLKKKGAKSLHNAAVEGATNAAVEGATNANDHDYINNANSVMLNDNTNISPSAIFNDSDKHVEDNEVTTIKPPAEIKTLPKTCSDQSSLGLMKSGEMNSGFCPCIDIRSNPEIQSNQSRSRTADESSLGLMKSNQMHSGFTSNQTGTCSDQSSLGLMKHVEANEVTTTKPPAEIKTLPKTCSDQSRGFGKAVLDPIKKWFNANLENPYPSQAEKESLAEKSGLSVEQVSNRLGRERHNLKKKGDTSFLNKTVKSTPKPVASSTAQKSSMGKLQKATLTKIPCDLNSTEPFGVTSCISEQLADEKVTSEGIDTSAPVPGTTYSITPSTFSSEGIDKSMPGAPVPGTTYSITPSTSKNTVSTLKSLTNGELPIEADHIELVWGCVCISAKKTQEVILRNKSQNVLQLKITSSNVSFRIVNCQTDPELKLVLSITLYPLELRRFSVIFTPTAIGAEVGELIFSPISTELQQQQTKLQRLMLYGYGGHANVKIENVMGVSNKLYLSLGKFENRLQIIKKFTVHNAGSVAAFVCTSFVSKNFYLYSKVTVFPTESVLQPKERIVVTVTYAPTKKDTEHFFLEFPYPSIKIGYIQLITGEEPVRGRIRRLCCKLKQEPGMACNTVQERLSGLFPNEIMPPDLTRFTETGGAMENLMVTVKSERIIVTVEKDAESGLEEQIGNSITFYSL